MSAVQAAPTASSGSRSPDPRSGSLSLSLWPSHPAAPPTPDARAGKSSRSLWPSHPAAPPTPDARAGKSSASRLAALREKIARLESGAGRRSGLAVGQRIGDPALLCGALNEAEPASEADLPALFGFLIALMARAQDMRAGPAFLVLPKRGLFGYGSAYGHGLARFGLDVARLILVETANDRESLWALEEALRSRLPLAFIGGALARPSGLAASRRLSLAAGTVGAPLLVLGPAGKGGASAAATRWRIATARCETGEILASWEAELIRCRSGSPGRWLMEWDHAAHRFRLASVLADRALPVGARLRAG